MSRRSARIIAVVMLALVLFACECPAYLYDAGIAQFAGAIIKDGTSTEWVAAPFGVDHNACATQFGAALGRAYGPQGAGFTVELATWVNNAPVQTIASWTVVPTAISLVYYYWDAASIPLASKAAGSYYALVFKPNDPDFAGAISYSNKAGCYYGWGYNDDTGWFRLQFPVCIRVDGAYVPEPGSLAVLAFGLAGFVARRRR